MKYLTPLTIVYCLLLTAFPVSGFAASCDELEHRFDLLTEEL